MKILAFNDSQHLQVQTASAVDGIFHARFINVTAEELKSYFLDKSLTIRMEIKEDGNPIEEFENYTEFSYIKEMTGRIFEVEMTQKGKDLKSIVIETGKLAEDANRKAEQNNTELQMAIAELTMVIATLTESIGGGETNV